MKLKDYPAIQELSADNIFLVDGPNGTKTINANKVIGSLMDLLPEDEKPWTNIETSEDYFNILDNIVTVEQRRNIYRGANLGPGIDDNYLNSIRNGTFKNMFIGDYWTSKGKNWRIADFNYFGKSKNHLVIISDDITYLGAMEPQNTAMYNGYANSPLRNVGKDSMLAGYDVYKYNDMLFDNRDDTSFSLYTCEFEVPSMEMIFGRTPIRSYDLLTQSDFPTQSFYQKQLALMRLNPDHVKTADGVKYWLRDKYSEDECLCVMDNGAIWYDSVDNDHVGVRHVYAIG